jgi:hypothetical protein
MRRAREQTYDSLVAANAHLVAENASLQSQLREAEDEIEAHRRGKCGIEAAQEKLRAAQAELRQEWEKVGGLREEKETLRGELRAAREALEAVIARCEAQGVGWAIEGITIPWAALQSPAAPTPEEYDPAEGTPYAGYYVRAAPTPDIRAEIRAELAKIAELDADTEALERVRDMLAAPTTKEEADTLPRGVPCRICGATRGEKCTCDY